MKEDVAAPGWEETVKKMKEHSSIENPWALSWYMHEAGYHPHDAADVTVLDAAHAMALDDGYLDKYDGVPHAAIAPSAGAKPVPEPTYYESETENDTPWGHNMETEDMLHRQADDDDTMGYEMGMHEHEDDDLLEEGHESEGLDLHQHAGHLLGGHPAMRGGAKGAEMGAHEHESRRDLPMHEHEHDDDHDEDDDDDDDMLLDDDAMYDEDGEVGPGEHLPQEHAAKRIEDPEVHFAGGAKGVADPIPTDPKAELESFSLGKLHGAKGRPSAEGDR